MPPLSILKAAFRFNRIHGDRENYRSPIFLPIQEPGILVCRECGTSYLINEAVQFSSLCEKYGGFLEKN